MTPARLSISNKIGGQTALFAAFVLATAAGCGPATSTVTGKVTTSDGKAVTDGSLIFVPATDAKVPGAPATVPIKSDGTYSTSAVITGKNTINFMAAPPEFPKGYVPQPSEPTPPSPLAGYAVEKKEIEVKSGKNAIDVTLVPPPPPKE